MPTGELKSKQVNVQHLKATHRNGAQCSHWFFCKMFLHLKKMIFSYYDSTFSFLYAGITHCREEIPKFPELREEMLMI